MSVTIHDRPIDATGVAESVRDATATRTPMRIAGRESWPDAGRGVRADRVLSLASVSGIVEYVPGDLTLTALAGTPLDEIAAATNAHGQWLPLDPPGSAGGTIGATVATASAGPLSHGFGRPRDLVLGVECVTGRGEIVQGGGRVTKNVAGFDLPRLFTGSWGTLGVLTRVTVRLRARPITEVTVALAVAADSDRLADRLRAVRAAPLDPLALELVSAALAAALGLGDSPVLLVRLGGNADSVRGQRTALDGLGDAADVSTGVWETLRGIEPPQAWTWRMSDLPSRLVDTWRRAEMLLGARGWMHASVGQGIVRCIDTERRLGRVVGSGAAQSDRSPFDGTLVVERVPAEIALPGAGDPVRAEIARRLRAAFDPHEVLNPGILGEVVA